MSSEEKKQTEPMTLAWNTIECRIAVQAIFIGLTLSQCRREWSSIKLKLVERLVPAGIAEL